MSDDGAQAAGDYVGRTVGGRFQLQSLLGAGGMASVYLAHDAVLDRQVAVKTLHTELGREQSFRERFRREAQSVARLSHPNIVSVFDSGEDDIDGATVPYIVMEYVEGKPLRSVLDEDVAQYGAMPTDKALKITGDVLAALEVSHEMGLVHRDIKPGNVMVTRRGVVKVMDFGIARAMQSGVTSMTQTGMVVGTPQYLSPEQALGRGVDARSDLYSVGIMLFELLTGRLPFDADSPLAIAYAHVQEEPVAPSSINQSVTPAADALVARTLKKNPNERFPSAESMRDEASRVSNAGGTSGAAPVIVNGGPAPNSGAGVGQSVFPPVGPGTPSGGTPQQPYAPQGGFGPSTPTPGANSAAPMGQGGFGAAASPYGQAGGSSTPPPYTMTPSSGGSGHGGGHGGGGKNTTVIASAAVAAVAVITTVIIVIAMSSGDDGGTEADDNNSPSASQQDQGSGGSGGSSGQQEEKFKGPDKSNRIEATKCTDAPESYSDRDKVSTPDLRQVNLSSVKDCIRKAGWKLDPEVEKEDENEWGKDTVLDQEPAPSDPFDPKEDTFKLTVSTGQPPS